MRAITKHARRSKMLALSEAINADVERLAYLETLVQVPTIKRQGTMCLNRIIRASRDLERAARRPVK